MHELTKEFRFDAAHTLDRSVDADASRRIHGHSYRAVVALRGVPSTSGMLVDLGALEKVLVEPRSQLDHHFLDEIEDLGPGTLENLAAWIWNKLIDRMPNLHRVTVHRDSSGESCTYWGNDDRN